MGCDDPGAVINRMASPDTKIVSLTITEGGYNVNPFAGEFDFNHPGAQHDLENPLRGKSLAQGQTLSLPFLTHKNYLCPPHVFASS